MVDDATNEDARKDASHVTAALYGYIVPKERVLRPAGEFNESRLVVRGNHVEHWLNGHRVVEFDVDSPTLLDTIRAKSRTDAKELESLRSHETPVVLQHHKQPYYTGLQKAAIAALTSKCADLLGATD